MLYTFTIHEKETSYTHPLAYFIMLPLPTTYLLLLKIQIGIRYPPLLKYRLEVVFSPAKSYTPLPIWLLGREVGWDGMGWGGMRFKGLAFLRLGEESQMVGACSPGLPSTYTETTPDYASLTLFIGLQRLPLHQGGSPKSSPKVLTLSLWSWFLLPHAPWASSFTGMGVQVSKWGLSNYVQAAP